MEACWILNSELELSDFTHWLPLKHMKNMRQIWQIDTVQDLRFSW